MKYTEKLNICLRHNFKKGAVRKEYKRHLLLLIDSVFQLLSAFFIVPVRLFIFVFTPVRLLFHCFTVPLDKSVSEKFFKNLNLINESKADQQGGKP